MRGGAGASRWTEDDGGSTFEFFDLSFLGLFLCDTADRKRKNEQSPRLSRRKDGVRF